jgi:hypothetical protein
MSSRQARNHPAWHRLCTSYKLWHDNSENIPINTCKSRDRSNTGKRESSHCIILHSRHFSSWTFGVCLERPMVHGVPIRRPGFPRTVLILRHLTWYSERHRPGHLNVPVFNFFKFLLVLPLSFQIICFQILT